MSYSCEDWTRSSSWAAAKERRLTQSIKEEEEDDDDDVDFSFEARCKHKSTKSKTISIMTRLSGNIFRSIGIFAVLASQRVTSETNVTKNFDGSIVVIVPVVDKLLHACARYARNTIASFFKLFMLSSSCFSIVVFCCCCCGAFNFFYSQKVINASQADLNASAIISASANASSSEAAKMIAFGSPTRQTV